MIELEKIFNTIKSIQFKIKHKIELSIYEERFLYDLIGLYIKHNRTENGKVKR